VSSSSNPHETAERALLATIAEALRPDQRLPVSEWADRYRVLSSISSAEKGQWRTARTPYLREVMDCLSPTSDVREVVLMFGAQLGKTETGNNWVGYVVDQSPAPTMLVLPTVELAKRASRQRLDPLFAESPRLSGKLRDKRSRDSGNNRLEKLFPGGILILTGANSAAGLRSMPVRFVFMDEVDAYPLDVEGEGDPVKLAEARTRNFHNYKILKTSTPTFSGTSRIEQAYEAGDQSRYEVPCPFCGVFQTLEWNGLAWERGEPETVAYRCSSCAAAIEERHKLTMLAGGRWTPTNPDGVPHVRSFHLSSLYAPLGWYSWERAVRDFEASSDDPEQRRVFVNTVLAETWKERGEAPDWENLYRRREKYREGTVPRGGLVLTAGVDVQRDRLELEVVAWGRRLESWSVEYLVLPGDTAGEQVWKDLDAVVDRTWPLESGGNLPLRMLACDAGYETATVYAWSRRHSVHRVAAVRGRDNLPLVVGIPSRVDVATTGKKRKRGARVWPVGTGIVKAQLYSWLRLQPPLHEGEPFPPGFMHFPERGEEWFRQLTSEQLVSRVIQGHARRTVTAWVKTRERNEGLDCRVYARAAAAIAGVDRYQTAQWDELERVLGLASKEAPRQDGEQTPPTPGSPQSSTDDERRGGGGYLSRWRTPRTT
jgi:phage terminase large subunit GpA-like protein